MTSEAIAVADGIGVPIDADDFTLFRLEPRFAQDVAQLDARWKALQTQVHPDRFAAEGAAAQHQAMRWAIRVNEAYRRLKTPLTRAAYLCELNGQPIDAEQNTAMPASFLMQQMAWRETLDDAKTIARIEVLMDEVVSHQQRLHEQLATLLDAQHDWPTAAARVRELMFVARFAQDVDRRADTLGA